jgi:hypothetical protein
VLLPLAYSVGPPGRKHKGIVPLVFWGPDYLIVPLVAPFYVPGMSGFTSPIAMSGYWSSPDGSSTVMVGPLGHVSRYADGTLKHMHMLTYVAGYNYKILFPLAYSVGEPGQRHQGVPFVYFRGPGYAFAPPLTSARLKHWNNSTSTWITPFFHRTEDDAGRTRDFHIANYFQGENYKLFAPLAYSFGPEGRRHSGFIPLYFQGPGYRLALPPLAYSVAGHSGVVPFYFQGPEYKYVPLAASTKRVTPDGSSTTWITPFFHRTTDAAGNTKDFHVANYFQGENYKLFAPLAYSFGPEGKRHSGFIPLYFRGPGYTLALPPLGYSVAGHSGVVPFYFQGPEYRYVPLAASTKRVTPDGSSTTWITPFFHRTTDAAGNTKDFHVANYFQGENYRLFAPLAYSFGPEGRRHSGFIPLYFQGPGYRLVLPPLGYSLGKHAGVVPFYSRGPGYQHLPLLATGRYESSDR